MNEAAALNDKSRSKEIWDQIKSELKEEREEWKFGLKILVARIANRIPGVQPVHCDILGALIDQIFRSPELLLQLESGALRNKLFPDRLGEQEFVCVLPEKAPTNLAAELERRSLDCHTYQRRTKGRQIWHGYGSGVEIAEIVRPYGGAVSQYPAVDVSPLSERQEPMNSGAGQSATSQEELLTGALNRAQDQEEAKNDEPMPIPAQTEVGADCAMLQEKDPNDGGEMSSSRIARSEMPGAGETPEEAQTIREKTRPLRRPPSESNPIPVFLRDEPPTFEPERHQTL